MTAHYRQARTHDADEQASLLSGWNQTYAQISPGCFQGDIEEAWIGDLQLFVERTDQALLQGGALPHDMLALGIPLSVPRPAVFCGAEGSVDDFYAFSGQGGFEFSTPAGLVMAGCSVPRAVLEARLCGSERSWLEEVCAQPHLRRPDPARLGAMRATLAGAFELLQSSCSPTAHAPGLPAAVPAALRESLLSVLIDLLVDGMQSEVLPRAKRWTLVSEARRMTLATPDSPPSVAALCVALGVSRRTLQNCFHEVLGMSPVAFLRAVRLAGVRRMLHTAPSVTHAAAHWGFWHFSNFAHDYRSLYGELPSVSWRRWHGAAAHRRVAH